MELPVFIPLGGTTPRTYKPARHIPGSGGYWAQGPHLRQIKKPHYAFIWPKDSRNTSTWGRLTDILTGKGPDIHITASADKMDYMANRQRRDRWGRHKELDHGPRDTLKLKGPWKGLAGNRGGLRYDFLTRTYRRPDRLMMTGAYWGTVGPTKGVYYPEFVRTGTGEWWGKSNWWDFDDFDR